MAITILNSNLTFKTLTYNNVPTNIILHHAEDSRCTPQDIHQWHLERGWSGAGYHYFVNKLGEIYSLRPENAQGSHCPGYNARSIGICAEGMYEVEGMPTIQLNAIVSLCSYIKSKYAIQGIYGHRQVYSTSCPGKNYPLTEIIAMVKSNTIPASVVPNIFVPSSTRTWLQVGDTGEVVKRVQTQLNLLGFNCGSVDGAYGKNTKNAVYAFQQAIGLQADGLAGSTTQEALTEICSTPTNGVSYPHMEYPTRYIQYRVGVKVDGVFGTTTEEAVKLYQANHNLVADGVVGPKTWGVWL